MTQELVIIKAFMRAFLVTFLIVIFIAVLWHYTLITLTLLVVAWFSLMLQLDPPASWDPAE